MKISKVVGIDLGTTNSVISMMGPDNKTIICYTDKLKRRTIPSCIVWDKKSQSIQVGHVAFGKRGTVPEPVTSIKKKMGDSEYRVVVGEKSMSPIEVSAEILKEMKRLFQEQLSHTPGCENYVVDRAVITIPAYFRSEAAEATAKAGELAGLEVVKTLQEPSASSAYYCWNNGIEDGIFMVFDLGGGTFDVSIVRYAGGKADVIGISGDNYLGGDTFDDKLAEHLLELLAEGDGGCELDLSPNEDEKDRQRMTKLKLSAEVVKKALSRELDYYHTHDGIFVDNKGATVNMAAEVCRDDFEEMISPILEGTLEKCREALKQAEEKKVTLDMIDGILLVGGSTHIPMVKEFVKKHFCDPSLPVHTISPEPFHDDPDMAVGFGAAIAAAGFKEITYEELPAGGSGTSEDAVLAAEVDPAVNSMGKGNIKGRIKAVKGSLPPNMTIHAQKEDGSFGKDFPVEADGSFFMKGLPAPSEDEPYQCSVKVSDSTVLSFRVNAAAVGIAAPSTTLSHELFIELRDIATGTITKESLMERGRNLPSSGTYQFKTTSEYSASVIILEDNTELGKIVLEFKEPVPVGSPVEVTLEIDEKSTKHVSAVAAGVSRDAYLEAPKLTPLTEADFEKLKADYDVALQMIPKKYYFEGKAKRTAFFKQAEDGIRAVKEGEQVQAREKYDGLTARLREMTADIIKPTREAFEKLAADCAELNNEKFSNGEIQEEKFRRYGGDIEHLKNKAAAGYEEGEQKEVTDAEEGIKEIIRELTTGGGNDRPPVWMIVLYLCSEIRKLIRQADENAKIPSSLQGKMQQEKAADQNHLNQVEGSVNQFTLDQDAVNMQVSLQPLYKRWEYYANYGDVVGR